MHETLDANHSWELSREQPWQNASAGQIFRTAILLSVVRITLLVLGFNRTIEVVRRLSRGPEATQVQDVDVAAAAYRVAAAGAFVPYVRCLERSLVLFYQLKRKGVPVVLRLGVWAYPFAAHAWVEYQNQPINEIQESIRHLSPLFEIR